MKGVKVPLKNILQLTHITLFIKWTNQINLTVGGEGEINNIT